ncbi:hypothetical protein ACFQVC_35690 [Streptomyces monticola]|uniref:DUF2752 domain-containing protein n=1 Tax=Streptomyces monticola TaxID=2666263 RepID=A0ABW2JW81_9ACTN
MTDPQPDALAEAGTDARTEALAEPGTDAPRGWLAPIIATLVTVPLAYFVYLIAGFSGMACDGCDGATAHAFDSSFDTALSVYSYGLLVPLGLLGASWGLPWQQRYAGRRVLFSGLAPISVVVLFLVFLGLVAWP